jgi:phospholipid/cholesterol/gamma-HCH transport system ATP-binding protein
MADIFIDYVNLHKSFGSKQVLRGLSLQVRRGETLVVVGGSGTGKSVLLRHTIGLIRPDNGEVHIDGKNITGYSEEQLMPVRRRVGMLFQAGALFDSMNVFDNVAFGLRESGDLSDEEIASRVAEKLGLVELEGVEELMPQDLSGGMRKRVALARAIAMEPECLLYDEPTTGLDPVTAGTIDNLIRSIQKALGVTSVVVTHDIKSAFTVGDRMAYLYQGELDFIGSIEEARTIGSPKLRAFLAGARIQGDPS